MIRGAIFDMDGLLFDTEKLFGISWAQTAREMGFTPDPAFHKAICGTNGVTARNIVRQFYPGADVDAFVERGCAGVQELIKQEITIMPGVHEILDAFKAQGMPMAVGSSSSPEYIEENLIRTGLRSYFDVLVSGDEVAHGKPEPDIFLTAAAKLNLPPEECYVFEDGVNGAKAGIAAGCATIMIPDLLPPTPECRQGCAGIYKSLNDALAAIRSGKLEDTYPEE